MTDQIDILTIASGLRSSAWERVSAARAMNQSSEASLAFDRAKADWMVANRDYEEVEYLMMALRS